LGVFPANSVLLKLGSMKKMSSRYRIGLLALAAAIVVIFTTCSPGYVIRAGIEEAKILHRSRPIAEVLDDPATDTLTRSKLRLVTQSRSFAQQQLGLAAGESYTSYSWVDSDTLLMVVSAARKDRFEPYLWWFPIVGHVPYKGYFKFEQAYAEARELEDKGYDTNVRPSGAFSTLGWFNDPLLNTILRYGEVSLAETVIHEITHNSLYVAGQAGFNESFANFVGARGAALFFCNRNGAGDARCKLAVDAWQDNMVFGAALSDLVRQLEQLYGRADLSVEQKVAQRAGVFQGWADNYRRNVVPQLRTRSFGGYANEPLNNARLIGTRLYYQRLDLFEQVFQKYNQDLRATVQAIIRVAGANSKDPFGAVEKLL
jgi:predicted aminopeptidase